ncbi:MAG: orotidine-5'-phosphate decarboxylase [Prevotellaceae bacterium]|jgi:orotidine-5'-phosphate decarboxylase|nr:orotidine-5'-phosphate decarboxylase [Prevotellaceae bacterium]
MNADQLYAHMRRKKSFLCVGLDSDMQKLPACVRRGESPLFAFNRAIVEATAPFAVAYKPNVAFYEAQGAEGWRQLEATVRYIRRQAPGTLIIADAKRGDIGNTSRLYAEAFFKRMDVDAVTLSPYMGRDTVQPFLEYPGRWAALLALTSNPSASDFEALPLASGRKLYEQVLATSAAWGTADNTMYVVGATQAAMLADIRRLVPEHFLLVPGVGAQGGSLHEVATHGLNRRCGLLVNASRSILYADGGEKFAAAAGEQAREMQRQMAAYLQ